jgi:predicted phage tail component-like protein
MPGLQGYTLTYDGVDSTTLTGFICEEVIRKLFGKNRDVYKEVAGREGAWHFPEKRGLKTLKVKVAAVSDGFPTPRREAFNQIATWVDKDEFKPLIISDEPDRFVNAVLAVEPDIEEWREFGRLELEFNCEPYSYALTVSQVDLTLTTADPEDTFFVTDQLYAYPVIEITADGGTINGFDLIFNGELLHYGKTITNTSSVAISSLSYTVVDGQNTDIDLTGAFNPGSVNMADVSGFFPVILPEQLNEITLNMGVGTTADAQVQILWRERYR